MKKQIIAATALMLAISSTAYASDNINIFVNGNALNTGAFIMNDSTYIPLRAVSEALGSNVNWDGNTRSVYIDSDEDTVTAQVIENASSSVVAIVGNYKPEYMTGTVSNYNELTAHGTGVVIKSGGIILTNAHVVSDIDNITVVFSDGESYAGQVQAIDKDSDLALVKVGRLGLKPISFAQSDSIFAGQSVVAIGTPLSLSMRNSASKGIVSGLNTEKAESMLSHKHRSEVPALDNSWEARIGLPTKKGVTVKTSSSSSLSNGDVINSINGVEVHSIVDFNKALRDTYSSGSINVIYTRNGEQISTDIVPNLK